MNSTILMNQTINNTVQTVLEPTFKEKIMLISLWSLLKLLDIILFFVLIIIALSISIFILWFISKIIVILSSS